MWLVGHNYNHRQAVAAIQESDSEFDLSGSESSEENGNGQLEKNYDANDSESDDCVSESSSSEDSQPSRRHRTIPSLPATPTPSVVGKMVMYGQLGLLSIHREKQCLSMS